jgi:pSer/pThr/pTyr-binding forkhead associated (FHA) protein
MVQDLGSTNGTYLSREGGPAIRVYGPTWATPGQALWLGARTAIPWERIHSLVEHVRP